MKKFINILYFIFFAFLISSFYPLGLQANDPPEELNAGGRQKRPGSPISAGESNQRQKQAVNTGERDEKSVPQAILTLGAYIHMSQQTLTSFFEELAGIDLSPHILASPQDEKSIRQLMLEIREAIAQRCIDRGSPFLFSEKEKKVVWRTFAHCSDPKGSCNKWLSKVKIPSDQFVEFKGALAAKDTTLTPEQKKRRFRAKIVEKCRHRDGKNGRECKNSKPSVLTAQETEDILVTFVKNKRFRHYFNQWLKETNLIVDPSIPEQQLAAIIKRAIKRAEVSKNPYTIYAKEEKVVLSTSASAQPVSNFVNVLATEGTLMSMPEEEKKEISGSYPYSYTQEDPFASAQPVSNFVNVLATEGTLMSMPEEEKTKISDPYFYQGIPEVPDLRMETPIFEDRNMQDWLTEDL